MYSTIENLSSIHQKLRRSPTALDASICHAKLHVDTSLEPCSPKLRIRAPPWWERSSRCLPVHLRQGRPYVVPVAVAYLLASRMHEPSRRVHHLLRVQKSQAMLSISWVLSLLFPTSAFRRSSIACCRRHAAAMYLGLPWRGSGRPEVHGGKSQPEVARSSGQARHHLHVGANPPVPCAWKTRSNHRRFNQKPPTWALSPCLSVYPFLSNQFSIPCFVLKHLQHLWLDLPPWCKSSWLLVCLEAKHARSKLILHLSSVSRHDQSKLRMTCMVILSTSSTVRLFHQL